MNIFVGNHQLNLIRNASKQRSPRPIPHSLLPALYSLLLAIFSLLFAFSSCSFDYGESDSSDEEMPNLVMENVEYVRVRSADPLARVEADRVEHYEKQSLMKLDNVTFEQYGGESGEVTVFGKAGYVEAKTDTGDFLLNKGVRLDVETEDIILETYQIEWIDETHSLSTGENEEVHIYRENGTRFTGTGLYVNARERTWGFTNSVRGTYINDDE